MQDRYAGDVGDFGKYGLLRALTAARPALRLAIVWYLVDEHRVALDPPNDGRHLGYLEDRQRPLYEDCDPKLYAAMRALLAAGERSVAAVERLRVFPRGTLTYSAPLVTPRRAIPAERRLAARAQWFVGALRDTRRADIVFVDPDNGLETSSVPRHAARASKYVYLDELAAFAQRDQSLVIYHHLGRRQPHREEIAVRVAACEDILERRVTALRFVRGTSRAFLIAPAARHATAIEFRLAAMLAGPWSRHFELVS